MKIQRPQFPHYPDLMIKDSDHPGFYIVNPKYRDQLRRFDEWVWGADIKEVMEDLDKKIDDFINNTPRGSLEP